jgi:endoplasmic reticulum junction formation protein lunapark
LPQRSDDAASFEKTLSQLAAKINKNSSKSDKLRQQARRVNLVWILYAGFAYIVAAIFLSLVSGVNTWGPGEYTAVAGGPVVCVALARVASPCFS